MGDEAAVMVTSVSGWLKVVGELDEVLGDEIDEVVVPMTLVSCVDAIVLMDFDFVVDGGAGARDDCGGAECVL